MKTKKTDKKLGLTKQTIANLSNEEMRRIQGGLDPDQSSYTRRCDENK